MAVDSTFRAYRIMGTLFAFLAVISPLIIVPIASYKLGNWWLLLGMLSCFAGVLLGGSTNKSILPLFTLFCIGYWLRNGFSLGQHLTFHFFCALYTYLCYRIMKEYSKLKAARELELEDVYFKELHP